jgi:WD40 repeat protein
MDLWSGEAITLPPRLLVNPDDGGSAESPPEAPPAGAAEQASSAALRPIHIPGYEILAELGRGGMGVVYQARQTKLNRLVALKMILAGGHAGETDLARFVTEAESIARLQHPNIVQIHEVGEHDGLPFFSLEFCPGGSQEKKLNGTPLPAGEAAALVETLARAMQTAHDKGVIHRDLKPANVLLAEDGTPKITDFGLAKRVGATGQTATGAIMGTPSYMAPEQAGGRSKEIGPAADVYALGAILYECLTGRPPFRAATPLDTMMQVLSDEPVPPTQLQPRLPRDLETICLKCLRKEAARRYPSAAALADDVRRFRAGLPITARPIGPAERLGRWYRRNPGVAGLLALVLLSLLLGAVVAAWFAVWANDSARAARASEENALNEKRRAEDEKRLADAARQLIEAEKARVEPLRNRAEGLAYAQQLDRAHRSWLENDAGHARELLDACRWDFRGWEYNYLNTLFERGQRSLVLGDRGILQGIAFSPDGKQIATAELNEGVRIWNRSSLELVRNLGEKSRFAECLAYSADGKRLASGNGHDGTIRVWNVETGEEVTHFTQPGVRILSICFSPDGGRLVSGGWDGPVKVWELASGTAVVSFQADPQGVTRVAFSPDGKHLATGGTEGAKLWDSATGKLVSSRPGQSGRVAFSPDGKLLAVSASEMVVLWEVATGKDVRLVQGHQKQISDVAFSPDGRRLVSGGWDRLVIVWDVATGRPDLTLKGHTGLVEGVAFSSDGLEVASYGREGTVKLWKTVGATDSVHLETPPNEGSGFRPAFNRDRSLEACGTIRCQIKVFDLSTGKERVTLAGHDRPLRCVGFSPDGVYLASGAGGFGYGPDGKLLNDSPGEVKVWDLATGREVVKLAGPPEEELAVMFSPDGKRLAAGAKGGRRGIAGGDLRVWEVGTWHQLWTVGPRDQQQNPDGLRGEVGSLALSPDGKRLATGDQAFEVRLWDLERGREIHKLLGHRRPASGYSLGIEALAFSPDSRQLASASDDRTVRLWDVESGAELHVSRGHTGMVYSLAFSPDGLRLASVGSNETGEDSTLKLSDTRTGRETFSLKVKGSAVAFSADGSRLLLAGDGETVHVWDASLRQKDRTVRGSGGLMDAVAFSPDGKSLACASGVSGPESDEVRVLDATTGQVQFLLNMASPGTSMVWGNVTGLAFSPDSLRLAAVDGEGTLKVWDMRTEQELLSLQRKDPRSHQRQRIQCVAFSPDFKFLAGGGPGLQLWDVTTGAEVRTLPIGEVSGLAFSPDGERVITITVGGSEVKISQVTTGRVLVTLQTKPATRAVAFSTDGATVAIAGEGAESKTVQLWDAHRGKLTATLAGHTGPVWSVAFSPDGRRLVSGSTDQTIRVWDLATGQPVETLRGHAGTIRQVTFSPSGQRVASASSDGTVKVWDLESGR